MGEEEKEAMMEKMMDKFLEGVTKEEKQKMMEKMMDKFFSDMTEEDKLKMIEKMMPKMMSGVNMSQMMPQLMPEMMKAMINKEGDTKELKCPPISVIEAQEDFRPWEFCPCRKLCKTGFDKKSESAANHLKKSQQRSVAIQSSPGTPASSGALSG